MINQCIQNNLSPFVAHVVIHMKTCVDLSLFKSKIIKRTESTFIIQISMSKLGINDSLERQKIARVTF
jgi:hypothetical protein